MSHSSAIRGATITEYMLLFGSSQIGIPQVTPSLSVQGTVNGPLGPSTIVPGPNVFLNNTRSAPSGSDVRGALPWGRSQSASQGSTLARFEESSRIRSRIRGSYATYTVTGWSTSNWM